MYTKNNIGRFRIGIAALPWDFVIRSSGPLSWIAPSREAVCDTAWVETVLRSFGVLRCVARDHRFGWSVLGCRIDWVACLPGSVREVTIPRLVQYVMSSCMLHITLNRIVTTTMKKRSNWAARVETKHRRTKCGGLKVSGSKTRSEAETQPRRQLDFYLRAPSVVSHGAAATDCNA